MTKINSQGKTEQHVRFLMHRKGINSVDDLAEAAKLTPPSIYTLFRNKKVMSTKMAEAMAKVLGVSPLYIQTGQIQNIDDYYVALPAGSKEVIAAAGTCPENMHPDDYNRLRLQTINALSQLINLIS